MDAQAVLLIISIIERAVGATNALLAVKDVMQKAQDEGREVTLDDFKQFTVADDAAREVLVKAINDAEG